MYLISNLILIEDDSWKYPILSFLSVNEKTGRLQTGYAFWTIKVSAICNALTPRSALTSRSAQKVHEPRESLELMGWLSL